MLFTPSGLLTAAAGVTLAAALMLVGPFASEDTVEPIAPAADIEAPVVTLVNGVMELTSEDFRGYTEALERGYSITDLLNTGEFTMSDERLSGRARVRGNAHADEMTWVWTESVYLENDGGAWVGTGYGYLDPVSTGGELGSGNHERLVLVGQGGYAGLTAIIDLDAANYDAPVEVTGVIVPFDLPPAPEAAPTTFE